MDWDNIPLGKKREKEWSPNTNRFIVTFEYEGCERDINYYTPRIPDAIDVFACMLNSSLGCAFFKTTY
jgi:hypothetical protein